MLSLTAPVLSASSSIPPLVRRFRKFTLHNVSLDKKCANDEPFMCPCCGNCFSKWLLFDGRPEICPFCNTLERHRASCYDLISSPPESLFQPEPVVAYFGPHVQQSRALELARPRFKLLRFDWFDHGWYSYAKDTVRADVQDIPLQSESLNGIIILHVLEHVPDYRKAIAELYRVLVPNGFVQHDSPCQNARLINCADHRLNPAKHAGHDVRLCEQPDHRWSFNCGLLLKDFTSAGFRCRRSPARNLSKEVWTRHWMGFSYTVPLPPPPGDWHGRFRCIKRHKAT